MGCATSKESGMSPPQAVLENALQIMMDRLLYGNAYVDSAGKRIDPRLCAPSSPMPAKAPESVIAYRGRRKS